MLLTTTHTMEMSFFSRERHYLKLDRFQRRFMRLFHFVGITVFALAASAAAADRPNVLFIIADDLNCDLGCYGDATAVTPNIDRLAASGVLFEHAYCQVPLCGPSRTSMLTGRTPAATGITRNPGAGRFAHEYSRSNDFRDNVPDTVTLPQLFKNNGYFAARVGKLYHYGVPGQVGSWGQDDLASWDYVVNPAGRDKAEENKIFTLRPGYYGGTLSWLSTDGTDREHTDGIGATAAISLMENRPYGRSIRKEIDRDAPFFLAVGFYRPHTPYVAPHAYFDKHPSDAVVLPEHSKDDKARQPMAAYLSRQKDADGMNDDLRQQAIAAYHASISLVDTQVGRLLDALDELGIADNTIVVFTSDHGYHLYDHGLWQKRSLFERSARIPLIIRQPKTAQSGTKTDALAGLIDLYPTLAEQAGLKPPKYIDGVSLSPALKDPDASVQDAVFTEQEFTNKQFGYSIRTDRYRYALWQDAKDRHIVGEVLFDMQQDPEERNNLIEPMANSKELKSLRKQIANHWPSTVFN